MTTRTLNLSGFGYACTVPRCAFAQFSTLYCQIRGCGAGVVPLSSFSRLHSPLVRGSGKSPKMLRAVDLWVVLRAIRRLQNAQTSFQRFHPDRFFVPRSARASRHRHSRRSEPWRGPSQARAKLDSDGFGKSSDAVPN